MVCSTRVSRPGTAANASPAVKTTAPRSTISFNKNWPGKAESPGKPCVGSHPGVVKRKLKVVRNIPTETRLAMPEMRGLTCRSAIPIPRVISITPGDQRRGLSQKIVSPAHERAVNLERCYACCLVGREFHPADPD